MELHTEKKMSRDEEKTENTEQIQHFLSVGPGSQDCRGQ
jgi:hypothetical protein